MKIMDWYCLKAKHKREKTAALSLKQLHGLTTYAPTITFRRSTMRGRIRFTEAMFTGYLFVYADMGLHLQRILRTAGVVGALRYGDVVHPVARGFVEDLRRSLGGDHYNVPDITTPAVDSIVRIMEGPFFGIIGRVLSANSAGERVKIFVDMVGREIELGLPTEAVMAVNEESQDLLRANSPIGANRLSFRKL